MATSLFLLLALGGFAAVIAAPGKECSGLEIFVCATLGGGDPKDLTNNWPDNEKDLDVRCKISVPILKCLYEFARDCPNAEFANLFTFFKEEYEITQRLCTAGDELRNRYLENAKCGNKHQDAIQKKCGTLEEFKEITTLTKDHCEKTEKTIKCHFDEFGNACGTKAKSFLQELLKPAQDLINKLCESVHSIGLPKDVRMVTQGLKASSKLRFF